MTKSLVPFRKVSNSKLQSVHRVSFLCKNPTDAEKNQTPHSTGVVLIKELRCNNSQTRGKREEQVLESCRDPLDFRGHLFHPPVFRHGALWPNPHLIFKSSWEGGSPLPTAFALKQLFFISNWNLQTAVCVLYVSSFPPWRQEFSCQHITDRHSSQHTQPVPVVTFGEEADIEGRVFVSKCILDLSAICIAFTRRNFHALLE